MRLPLAFPALALMAACAAPLTGDAIKDCLSARNQAVQAQNAVTAANGLLAVAIAAHRSASEIDALQAGVTLAQTNLTNAQAMQVSLCIAPPPILIQG